MQVSKNWKALAPLIKGGGTAPGARDAGEPTVGEAKAGSGSGEIWFDVDEQTLRKSQLEAQVCQANGKPLSIGDLFSQYRSSNQSASQTKEAGKYVALDCEMVGVGPGGMESALARVSIVNYHGEALLDSYVRPVERITDYRTAVSGIEPRHLVEAPNLATVQKQVWELLQGKILVGHSLKNDFRVLLLEHPRTMTRDTSKYRPFRRIARGKSPGLKRLAKAILGIDIQQGAHDSVDDARIALLLYRAHKNDWENYLFRHEGRVVKEKQRARKQALKSSSTESSTIKNV